MSSSTTKWRYSPLALCGVGLAFAAEAAANAIRGYGLGAHELPYTITFQGHALSVTGVAMTVAALALSLAQTKAATKVLRPGTRWPIRLVSGLTALVLIFVSACAMSSHMLAAMRGFGSDQATARATFDRAKDAFDAAQADFQKVKDADTVDAVQARIAAAGIDANIWRKTNGCTDVTRKSSQEECAPFFKLQPALAAAESKADLLAKLPALQAKLDALKRPDPQSDAEAFVNSAWAWAAAFAIILVATLGPALFAEEVDVPKIQEALTGAPEPAAGNGPTNPPLPPKKRGRRTKGNVVEFSEEFRKRHGRSPSGSEIRAEFPDLPKSTAYDYAARTRLSG